MHAHAMAGIIRTSLLDLNQVWESVPPLFALVGSCLYCAGIQQYPDQKSHFLVHFIASFFTAFGGGTVTALLLLHPSRAPISLLSNGTLGVIWVSCWWLMNYAPYNVPGRLFQTLPLKMLTKGCWAWCRAKNIMGRVLLACQFYPGSVVAPFVIGTLTACSGKLTMDTVKLAQGQLTSPHELMSPGYTLRSAFLAASFSYLAVHCPHTKLLLPKEAAAVLTTTLVLHALLTELTGKPLDWTRPLMTAVLTLLNIPLPPAAATSGNAKRPSSQRQRRQHATSPTSSSSHACSSADKAKAD